MRIKVGEVTETGSSTRVPAFARRPYSVYGFLICLGMDSKYSGSWSSLYSNLSNGGPVVGVSSWRCRRWSRSNFRSRSSFRSSPSSGLTVSRRSSRGCPAACTRGFTKCRWHVGSGSYHYVSRRGCLCKSGTKSPHRVLPSRTPRVPAPLPLPGTERRGGRSGDQHPRPQPHPGPDFGFEPGPGSDSGPGPGRDLRPRSRSRHGPGSDDRNPRSHINRASSPRFSSQCNSNGRYRAGLDA